MGKKKVILIALVAALAVIGISGVIFAQAADSATSANTTQPKTIAARVAGILGIDQQKVEDAFAQAHKEAQLDALKARLKAMVDAGKITQAQADEYLKWSQSKPDMTPYQQQMKDWMQNRPNLPDELKQWQQAKPDVPMPMGPGIQKFRGGQRGMMAPQGGAMNFQRQPLQ